MEGIAHRGDFDLRSHMEGKLVKNAEGCLEVEKDAEGKPRRSFSEALAAMRNSGVWRELQKIFLSLELRNSMICVGAKYSHMPRIGKQ